LTEDVGSNVGIICLLFTCIYIGFKHKKRAAEAAQVIFRI